MIIRELFTRLGFQVDGNKLSQYNRQISGAKKRLSGLARQASGLGSALKYGLLAFAAKLGINSFFKDFVTYADKARKSAQALGTTTEEFQKWGYTFEISGLKLEDFNKVFSTITKDTREGSKTVTKAFQSIGVSVKDSTGKIKPATDLLLEASDVFSKMPDSAEKTALAIGMFGKKIGPNLIPLLNQGRAGIEGLHNEIEKLGGVVGDDTARQAEEFNDNVLRMQYVSRGLRNQLMNALLPALNALFSRVYAWLKSGDNFKKLVEQINKTLRRMVAVIGLIVSVKVYAQIAKMIKLFVVFTQTIRKLGTTAAIAQAKFLLIPAVLLLIVALIEDLYSFTQGKDSLFGRMLEKAGINPEPIRKQLGQVFKIFADLGARLLELWRGIWGAFGIDASEAFTYIAAGIAALVEGIAATIMIIVHAFDILGTAIGETLGWIVVNSVKLWDFLVEGFKVAISSIVEAFTWLKDSIVTIFDTIGDFFSGIFDGAIEGLKVALRQLPDFALDALPASVSTWVQSPTGEASGEQKQALAEARQQYGNFDLGSALGFINKAAEGQKTQNLSVGNVSVNVQGSTNMGGNEMAKAVNDGVESALRKLLNPMAMDNAQ